MIGFFWSLKQKYVAPEHIISEGYTLCHAARWHGAPKRDIMFSSEPESGKDGVVQDAYDLLEEADAVVHYNGKNFDTRVLNREFVDYGLGKPAPYHQIDLYKVVKENFHLPSYKLDFVAQHFGLGQKVPHKGMELWDGCMKGDEKSWKVMEKYNKQDVHLLHDLYELLLPWIKNHPNHALYSDSNRPLCPNCGSTHIIKKGMEYTQTQAYQRYKCEDCGTPIRGRYTELPREKGKLILVGSKL